MIIPIQGSKAPFWPSYAFVALAGLFTFLAVVGQSGELKLILAGSVASLVTTLPLHKALMLLESGKALRALAAALASWTVFAVVMMSQFACSSDEHVAPTDFLQWLERVALAGLSAAVVLALPLFLVWLVPAAIWFLVTNARSFKPIA